MTDGQINSQFLRIIGKKAAEAILDAIAMHYGITRADAHDEVTHDEAEHLLDYLTGSHRAAASVLMQRHGFAHVEECV